MYIFLNELSFNEQAVDDGDCYYLIEELMKVLDKLKRISGENHVYVSRRLWEAKISKDNNLKDYIYKNRMSDRIRLLMILLNKGPYIERFWEDYDSYHECQLKNNKKDVTATSVAAAVCFDGMLAGLQKSINFRDDIITILYRENDSDFIEKSIDNHYDCIKTETFVEKFHRENIISYNDLWDKREILFPYLVFCDEVKDNLEELSLPSLMLQGIIRHLSVMNGYMKKIWEGEITLPNYNQMGVRASTETEVTLTEHGHLRTFICPDGKERIFSWHSKLKGKANIRIHFYPPDGEVKDFLIGYIGAKLATQRYRT